MDFNVITINLLYPYFIICSFVIYIRIFCKISIFWSQDNAGMPEGTKAKSNEFLNPLYEVVFQFDIAQKVKFRSM